MSFHFLIDLPDAAAQQEILRQPYGGKDGGEDGAAERDGGKGVRPGEEHEEIWVVVPEEDMRADVGEDRADDEHDDCADEGDERQRDEEGPGVCEEVAARISWAHGASLLRLAGGFGAGARFEVMRGI